MITLWGPSTLVLWGALGASWLTLARVARICRSCRNRISAIHAELSPWWDDGPTCRATIASPYEKKDVGLGGGGTA